SGQLNRVITTSYPAQLIPMAHLIHDAKATPWYSPGLSLPFTSWQKRPAAVIHKQPRQVPTCEFT
ncbi:MAG: hypothetical protein VB817_07780, partial [Pirellulaceae bacterium]